jgi:hypothetical protein
VSRAAADELMGAFMRRAIEHEPLEGHRMQLWVFATVFTHEPDLVEPIRAVLERDGGQR